MKTFLRRAGWVLAVLLLLAVIGVWRWQINLGPALRDRLVGELPGKLGVEVEIGGIELDFLRGRAEVRGVRFGNPEGFISPDLFRSEVFSVDYSPLSFLRGEPRVREVLLRGSDLTWETRGGFDTNWRALLARTGAPDRTGKPSAEARAPRAPRPANDGAGFLVERVRVEDAVLRVVGTHSASNGPPVRLPRFDILRPGREDGDSGLTILFKVMGALAVGAQQAASNAIPASVEF